MTQTLEQVNALRRMKGEEPLTELPKEEGNSGAGNEGSGEANTDTSEDKNKPKDQPIPEAVSMTDDAVLKYLKEKGFSVNSLDDLNKPVTEADIAKQADDRENAKLTYGLNKGLFNRKTHEQFILDKSNKQQLVFAQYYQDAKKEDPELSDQDIQDEFAAKYGLDAEPNTRKHKRGQQEIDILSDIILKNKYQNIYKLDSEYDVYEKQTTTQKEFERKLISEAPNYKKTVDDVFGELKKIKTKFSEDESYEVELLDDAIGSLKEKFMDKDFVAQKISQGYTKDEIKDIAFNALLSQNWPLIAKEIVKQAIYKQQKGVKGITPLGTQQKSQGDSNLSEEQQKVLQRLFPNHQQQAAN
jgi:hypothetical protein